MRKGSHSFMLLQDSVNNVLKNRSFKDAAKRMRPLLLSKTPAESRRAARSVIERTIIQKPASPLNDFDLAALSLAFDVSASALKNYATLHDSHVQDIESMIQEIELYLNDPTRTRPLNFLLYAPPGAGKSHFVRCVTDALMERRAERPSKGRGVKAVSFNMASMGGNEEFARPIEAARNVKVEDHVPLVFLDEFDSAVANFAMLLPLLWDGALGLGHHDLALGKSIIVLAGSSDLLADALQQGTSMKRQNQADNGGKALDGKAPKLTDLLSRINGSVISIPKLADRRSDVIPITLSLLRRRFGPAMTAVPWNLLHFVGQLDFHYDVRSITHLLEAIRYKDTRHGLRCDNSNSPMRSVQALSKSSLMYHLYSDDGPGSIVDVWNSVAPNMQQLPSFPMQAVPDCTDDEIDRFLAARICDVQQTLGRTGHAAS